jgi:hypothetical protein
VKEGRPDIIQPESSLIIITTTITIQNQEKEKEKEEKEKRVTPSARRTNKRERPARRTLTIRPGKERDCCDYVVSVNNLAQSNCDSGYKAIFTANF